MTDAQNSGAVEEWRAVSDPCPGYEVSDLGRVRSVDRKVKGKDGKNYALTGGILHPRIGTTGYKQVTLRAGKNARFVKSVHRLVAAAFCSRPTGKNCVNHIDNDPLNNEAENLEWCTQAENLAHAVRQGRMRNNHRLGKRSPSAALSDHEVVALRKAYAQGGISLRAVGVEFGISKRAAQRCVLGETYADVSSLPTAPTLTAGEGGGDE